VRVPIIDEIANGGQAVGNCVLRNHLAIYANSFAKRDEMRGYEEAGAIALRATYGVEHGAHRPFAVCAGDVDDLRCSGACAKRRAFDTSAATICVEQAPYVFQAQLNAEALKAVKPGERLLIIRTRPRRLVHRAAAK
jgi:hypothetical protein